MKIGDIVKSRHTGQEYRVVEMIKNINALMFVFHLIQKNILFLMMKLQLQRISHGKDVLFKILKN